MTRIIFSFLVSAMVFLTTVGGMWADEKHETPEKGLGPLAVLRIQGAISPGSAGYLESALIKARDQDAQAVIIELDTPGGLAQSMRSMVKAIMNAPMPVVVFVSPTGAQAASAGVMVTMAADLAVMAPGTNIGAAHPVAAGGGDVEGEMKKKVVNDMVAFAQGIAKQRDRSVDWAKKAVEQSVSVTASEAVKLDVVDFLADDRQDLIRKLNGRTVKRGALNVTLNTENAPVVEIFPSLRDRILSALADPNLAYILLMIGLAGLYFELSHPGVILPGVVGGVSLILAFYSLQTLPVNYAGILLILLGIVLFILEIKVTSYGMLTVGGLASLVFGSLMLFDTPQEYLRVSLRVMVPILVFVGGFFVGVTFLVVKAHARPMVTGPQAMIGLIGPVKEWQDAKGKVLVHGEWWFADGDESFEPGERVVVTGVEGIRLKVRRAGGEEA